MLTSGTWGRVLGGLQLFRCDIWGFWRQGKRMILGSPVAPSSSWFCAPFTLSLLNRHNSGEDLTGGLLRVAKTACIGSSCPLSIPQLSGVFCRGWFPLWFCDSTGGTFITSVAVCGSDVDHPISGDIYELFIHCQSFASVFSSFQAYSKRRGFYQKFRLS